MTGASQWPVWASAVRLRGEPTGQMAFGLFKYSVTYLALLFAAIAVDRLLW